MKLVKLESIAEIIAGQSPPSDTYNQSGDGLPFFQGKADFGETYPVARYWCKIPTKIALPEDILMSVRAPVGPVNICNLQSCIGRGLSAIRVNNMNSSKYVYYYLKVNEKEIEKLGVGSTFKAITQKEIHSLKISVPEKLEDQIKIATLLGKVEALIKQRKESIDLLDVFLKSIFLEMFGDPVRNEKGWARGKMIDYSDCIVPGRDKPKSFSGNIPWIRTEDLVNKGFFKKSIANLGLLEDEIKEVKGKIIPIGSVIITCVGQLNIISINKIECIINQQLHSFQCKNDLNNIFLMYALSFQEKFMYNNASTTTVAYMNKTICNSIPIIVPPIVTQNLFAQIVEKKETLKSEYQKSLKGLKDLFNSVSQKAFKGELNLSSMDKTTQTKDITPNKQIESLVETIFLPKKKDTKRKVLL